MAIGSPIVVFSHLRWDFVYQRPQHLLSRLARTGAGPLRRGAGARPGGPSRAGDGPTPAPGRDGAPAAHAARGAGLPRRPARPDAPMLERRVRERLGAGDYGRLVLHADGAAARSTSSSRASSSTTAWTSCRAFTRRAAASCCSARARCSSVADVVFTGGPSLYRAKKDRHPNVHCFPSSVDAAHFAPGARRGTPKPADQARIPHPRLGFFGVIDERFDLPLLDALADAHPEWQFVHGRPGREDRPGDAAAARRTSTTSASSRTSELPALPRRLGRLPAAVRAERVDALHQPDQDARIHGGRASRSSARRSPTWPSRTATSSHLGGHAGGVRRRLRARRWPTTPSATQRACAACAACCARPRGTRPSRAWSEHDRSRRRDAPHRPRESPNGRRCQPADRERGIAPSS